MPRADIEEIVAQARKRTESVRTSVSISVFDAEAIARGRHPGSDDIARLEPASAVDKG